MSLEKYINTERLVNTFIELVKIDSESGSEQKIREYLLKKLERFGITASVDHKGNITARYGENNSGNRVMFSAHMDTVKPGRGITPIIADGYIRSDGTTILGADDKSGIAVIIEMLEIITENKLKTPSLLLVFTVEEEIGVQGVRYLKGLKADFGFVLDTGGHVGTVVYQAPTHYRYTAKVIGKSAHAGIEPQKGVNAIMAASLAISKLQLGKIDEDTVANVGVISGGQATNIIPDTVEFRGEVRSLDDKKVVALLKKTTDTINEECKRYKAKVELDIKLEYSGFMISKSHSIMALVKNATINSNLSLSLKKSCGGSDANYFNKMKIPTLVLSTGMESVHTVNERIKISEMVKAVELILYISDLCR